MNEKKVSTWLLIVVLLLIGAVLLNLCGLGDWLKDTLDIDDDANDDDDDLPDDDDDIPEDDEEEEDEEEDWEAPHCETVRYSKVITGDMLQTTTWTALGLSRGTYLERTSQIVGGYKWTGYWNGESLGWVSDPHATRFTLLTELRTHHASGHMNDLQLWWYECMITTGYGGIF